MLLVLIPLCLLALLALLLGQSRRQSARLRQLQAEEPTLRQTVSEQADALQRLLVDIEGRARAHAQLSHSVEQVEQDIALLNRLHEILLHHRQLSDAHHMFARLMEEEFPDLSGILSITASDDPVAGGASLISWGRTPAPDRGALALCMAHRRGEHWRSCSADFGVASLCVPLQVADRTVGHLLLDTQGGPFDERTLVRIEMVSRQAAFYFATLSTQVALSGMLLLDSATGLYHSHYLRESLKRELRRLSRSQRPLGLMVLAVDDFQRLSLLATTDERTALLRDLALLCQRSVRGGDIVARGESDEIIIMMPDAPLAITERRAEQLRHHFTELRRSPPFTSQPMTLSAGVATFPMGALSGETLLRRAYAMLRRAQSEGGDRTVVADEVPTSNAPPVRRLPLPAEHEVES